MKSKLIKEGNVSKLIGVSIDDKVFHNEEYSMEINVTHGSIMNNEDNKLFDGIYFSLTFEATESWQDVKECHQYFVDWIKSCSNATHNADKMKNVFLMTKYHDNEDKLSETYIHCLINCIPQAALIRDDDKQCTLHLSAEHMEGLYKNYQTFEKKYENKFKI